MKDSTLILTIIGVLISLLGLFVGVYQVKKAKPKHKKPIKPLHPKIRIELLEKVLKFKHKYVLELFACVYIFMPSGEIIFGAAWTNHEWIELLKNYIEKNPNEKLTVASIGQRYFLVDLISGVNIKIPIDPQKGMTIDQNGATVGQMLMFVKY